MAIDTNFKMYADVPGSKDPDTYSQTLRDYHLQLWNKPLPSGEMFVLTAKKSAPYYLYHSSGLGDFCLASDSIIHTYSRWNRKPISDIVRAFPKADIDAFYDLASTIGGYVVFPANKIERKPTINGIRGMHPKIRDRFDLTLECIRLWYIGRESPLFGHLDRYGDFFRLFGNFQGYVSFFLLEDLVDADGSIQFWLPFDGFDQTNPLPDAISEYREYMKNVSAFVMARNMRIGKTDKTLNNAEFAAAAAAFTWTFAKTMPWCPHEYIVRGKTADDDIYFAMFRTIEARGEWGVWNNTPRQYLHPGDGYYYWKMTDDIQESIIINRAKETEADGREQLRLD